ncbi:MAG: hypothetical protein AVDCRST_MAG62-1784, partial [uncultured Sphingomonas sp.]
GRLFPHVFPICPGEHHRRSVQRRCRSGRRQADRQAGLYRRHADGTGLDRLL